MEHLIIPEDYFSPLSLYDTQVAIKTVKDFFQSVLAKQLNLLPCLLSFICGPRIRHE